MAEKITANKSVRYQQYVSQYRIGNEYLIHSDDQNVVLMNTEDYTGCYFLSHAIAKYVFSADKTPDTIDIWLYNSPETTFDDGLNKYYSAFEYIPNSLKNKDVAYFKIFARQFIGNDYAKLSEYNTENNDHEKIYQRGAPSDQRWDEILHCFNEDGKVHYVPTNEDLLNMLEAPFKERAHHNQTTSRSSYSKD